MNNPWGGSQASSQPFSGFGPTQTTAPTFSGLGATSNPKPFGASFGANSTSSLRGASVFGSILGGPTSPPGQNGQSQAGFATSSLAQGDKPLQPAFFNSLLEKGRQSGLGSNFAQLPTLELNLDDITNRARALGGSPSQRPTQSTYRSTLNGGASTTSNPFTKPSPTRFQPANSKAEPPTQPKRQDDPEVDNDMFVRGIQQRSRQAMIEENFARTQRDFEDYLEESMTLNWDEQRLRIYEHFGLAQKLDDNDTTLNFANTTKGTFGKSTRKGRSQGVGGATVGSTGGRSVLGRSGMEKSVIGTPGMGASNAALFSDVTTDHQTSGNASDDRFVREREENFAKKVGELNVARSRKMGFAILHEFAEIETNSGGETPSQVIDGYEALIHITGEMQITPNSLTTGVKERQFARGYLSENSNDAEAIAQRRRVIDGSRKFLEQQCYREIEKAIAQNPREAQLGGIPTTTNKIRAFVRIQAARKNLVSDEFELQTIGDNDMCWPLIFYLLRCGLVREAADYCSLDKYFRTVDRNFITYIQAYANSPDRRLGRTVQEAINGEYQQRSRNNPEHSVDPYRLACYKIIGRCELHRRNLDNIPPRVEDWIWLQFSMAREVNRGEEPAGDVFGLDELCESIVEIGQRHFSKASEGSGPFGTYFLLQILGGMFEQAIAYLYNYSYVSAVHFAIALDYYGLLRVSDFFTAGNELLTSSTMGKPQINFGRMIGYYTRDFRSGNAEAAVDYLVLICLNADLGGELGKSYASVCHEALRELVLETREFALLLGDIKSDGARLSGAIEDRMRLIKLADQDEFLNAVTVQAAVVADDSGRTTDAVLLYHLAEDYDNVISIINRALSEAMSVDLGDTPMKLQPLKPRSAQKNGRVDLQEQLRQQEGSSLSLTSVDDPAVLAKNMIGLYNSNALYYQKIKTVNRDACGTLLQMSEARMRIDAGRWYDALDSINSLGIVPLKAAGSMAYVRSKATSFTSLPTVVARTVGQLLTWSIHCISKEREIIREQQYEDPMRIDMADQLLLMAKDLMVFAGMVRYKLPPRVFETLARAGMDAGAY